MGHHLDALLKRRFRAAKCLALLKLTVARIKVARNQKTVTAQKLRKEIAQLLRSGQDGHAYRLKTDNLIRLQNIMKAFDLIEQYCNLLISRLQIMESQRSCPLDVKEAVASLVYAAPRCPDLAELPHVREMFATKYGKEFVTAIGQLRPDCGVNKQIIELLSTRPATGQMRVELMKEIAAENNIDWKGENEFTMPPADPPSGSDNLNGGSEEPRTDSKHFQASKMETRQNAYISTAESGDRTDLGTTATVGSFGAPSRPAGTVIAPDFQAESVEGNISHLTELDSPPQVSLVETLSTSDSDSTEAAEGVQDAVEISVPDPVDSADMEFVDAVEEIFPDSIEAAESNVHFHDVIEDKSVAEVNDDLIEGPHENTSHNMRNSDEVDGPNAVVESPPQVEGLHGRESIRDEYESVVDFNDTSEENRESVSNEVAGPNAGLESPLISKMLSSKTIEATGKHLQKNYGEHDYLGSRKGRQYKDFASAVQVAFESAALAAEAAQAAMGLARFYDQQPGHNAFVGDDVQSSSNIVLTSTDGVEIPTAVSDAGGKVLETNVDQKVSEEPEVRPEIGRITDATIDTGLAKLDSSDVTTCTDLRQAGEPSEITLSGEGDVDGLSNPWWDSRRISQEKTSPAEEITSLGDFKQKSARISDESADPDMINPVSSWDRRIPGARLKNETDCMYDLMPKFDAEDDDSDALVFSEDLRRTSFPGASNETQETTKPGWGSKAGSALLTSEEEVSYKQSRFTDGVFDDVGGGKLKFESFRLHKDLTASLKGNERSSNKLNFDDEVNDGRIASGVTSWDNDREKAEPLQVNEVVRRSEGKLRWNTSSPTVAQDIHVQRKSGGHGESRRTHRAERKPSAPPEEQQKEAAAPSVSYGKSEAVGDKHEPGTLEQVESRRTQWGERKPSAPSPEEQQEAAAASVSYRKSEAVVDEHDLRTWGQGESRERKPFAIPRKDQQKEAAAASVSYGRSEAVVDEHELRTWGHGESQRTQMEPGRPVVPLPEEQDAASVPDTSRNGKAKLVEFQEQKKDFQLKKKVGHGANWKTATEQQRLPLVSFPEEEPPAAAAAATFVLSRKSEAELDAENEKKGGHVDNERTRIEQQPKWHHVGPQSEEVTFVPSSEAGLDQNRRVEPRSSISKQTVPPPPASTTLGPPAASSTPPPTSLTSSSSDPVVLAATPPPVDLPPPTGSTSSAPAPPQKLPTATSAPSPAPSPSPHSGRAHPKLPDYDALAAQFLKLREEKRAARPS